MSNWILFLLFRYVDNRQQENKRKLRKPALAHAFFASFQMLECKVGMTFFHVFEVSGECGECHIVEDPEFYYIYIFYLGTSSKILN